MAGMIVTNVQMGVSSVQGNEVFVGNCCHSSFSSSRFSLLSRPSFGIDLNVSNRKLRRRLVSKALLRGGSDGSILRKEFEFKPSFDEYLKVMESVKTVRDKRQDNSSEKKKSLGDENEVDVKSRVSEGNLEKERMGVLEKDGSVQIRDGFKKRDTRRKNITKIKGRFESKVRSSAGKTDGKVGRDTMDEKWQRQKTRPEEEVEEDDDDDDDDYSVGMRKENEHKGRSFETWRKKGNDDGRRGYRSISEVHERERSDVGNNEVRRGFQKNSVPYDKFLGKDDFRQKQERGNRRSDSRWGYESMSELDERERSDVGNNEVKRGFQKNSVSYDKFLGKDDFRQKQERGNRRSDSRWGYESMSDLNERERSDDGVTEVKMGRKNNSIRDDKFIGKDDFQPRNERVNRRTEAFVQRVEDKNLNVERAPFRNVDEPNGVMDGRRRPRVEMDERIQKLAMSLNGANVDMPEWIFSKMMKDAQILYTDHAFSRLIQILGKLGNWKRVLQVIEWLQIRERFKSHKLRYIYTSALCALGKARRPVEALNVFDAMQQQMSSYPDLVAYHSIAVTLGQAGHIKELFDVIDIMRSPPKKKFKTGALGKWDPRLEPDIIVYNAVLNACAQREHWEGAFWVLQQLKEKGLQPSVTTYGLVMEVMFACGKYNLVHDFFKKVQKSSIPNALTYRVLVNTLWKEGKIDEAIQAVKDMEKRGIVGSAALYYDFARCLCSAGRSQDALKQIEKVCKVANKPLVVTYTGIIQACLDSGHVKDAAYILDHMKNFCSPNLVTYNIVLKGYLKHGMFQEGKELFQKMLEDGRRIKKKNDQKMLVAPDIYTFNTLLDACIAENQWDDFDYVYKMMLHHGYHFNAKRHLQMILSASRAGKGELVEITWTHLVESDRTPPISLIKERFCMKLKKEDYEAALSCICTQSLAGSPEFSKKAWSRLLGENSERFEKGTLARLVHEISNVIARTDEINPLLDNLLASCRELSVASVEPTETFSTIQTVPALQL